MDLAKEELKAEEERKASEQAAETNAEGATGSLLARSARRRG
jgi:hypothetical protein